MQPPTIRVPVIVGVIRVDLVHAADDLDHSVRGIVGDELGIRARPAHAKGDRSSNFYIIPSNVQSIFFTHYCYKNSNY